MSAPRVVFKDDKNESKKPLIKTNTKSKEKNEVKEGKDKTGKGSEEKLNEGLPDKKEKKENGKDKKLSFFGGQKETTAELVPATPPPKATTQKKKKGLLGFKKSSKSESVMIPADLILDAPSMDDSGPAPLIPVPSDVDTPLESEIFPPETLPPNNLPLSSFSAIVETSLISPIPELPELSPPPFLIPEIPALQVSTPQNKMPQGEIPVVTENPALPVSRPASQNEVIPIPPSITPSPPPSSAISDPPPAASSPSPSSLEPEVAAEAVIEVADEKPPSPPMDPPAIPPSPTAERPISALSALSALERAEDMSAGKRTPPADNRILSALEKARRKASPLSNSTQSSPVPPPPEDLPPSQSSAHALPELPPIDYEAGYALPQKPAQVNGINHRQASPVLEGITEEGTDGIPELLVIPPPPPRRALPDLESPDPVPVEPHTYPSPSLFFPPPPLFEVAPASPEFSEADISDMPAFDDEASDAYSPELLTSEWRNEEYTAEDELDGQLPDEQNLPECYSNGIIDSGNEIHSGPAYEGEYQDDLDQTDSSLQITQDSPLVEGAQAENRNSVIISTDDVYEEISPSSSKKKGKNNSSKNRKGTPKNPYDEATPETVKEKTKTGRFGKSDKKAAAEGPDEKELKKKEKQRLEKEKKELKEKQEREKKEQKEREKKETALKKKFKLTGQEDAMYQATVTVTTKGRKDDLPVKTGDVISIIRTTNCPKGKWLARDSSNNYGYIAVDHVELDIKEMLEVGKKAVRKSSSNFIEADVASTGSRASNHFPQSAESFTDDSEEWTCDDDEPLSAPQTTDPFPPSSHTRTLSMPDMGNKDLPINHQHSHSDMATNGSQVQVRHEALQKLATFFHSPPPEELPASCIEAETSPKPVAEEVVEGSEDCSTQEVVDFDPSEIILPPPDLYADIAVE
ncbi:bromodomain-containing protein 4 isoform X2 [Melanotaenia boesemani]|nr:bromodomain-containing protein 4 isoform X2 [Melanotaenia boesemani]